MILSMMAGAAIATYLWKRRAGVSPREVAEEVRAVSPGFASYIDSEPAVQPEKCAPPIIDRPTVNAPDAEKRLQRLVEDPDVRAFLLALRDWAPQYHEAEASYGDSLQRHVARRSAFGEFDRWPPKGRLRLEGDESKVLPDFQFRGRVLVEIKGDIFTASETDRALGQMVRYALAWKQIGPALLIVCGECRPLYRALVTTYITLWRKELRIPVTAYFLRDQMADDVPASVKPEELNRREVSLS